jgi:two-component system OmpR family response regulator
MGITMARNRGFAVTILLVEDNTIIGEALRDHLLADCWDVHWSTALHDAKCAADGMTYALVLLDLHFPEGSGLDLLRHLRKQSPVPPVIILSAYDQVSDRIEALEIGAVDFLVKPFDLREMMVRIRRCLKPREVEPPARS